MEDEMVKDSIWKLCNMAFDSVVAEEWRSGMTVPCTRIKRRGMNARTIEVLVSC